MQLYIVELPKADQQVAAGRHGAQALAALNAWVAYFQLRTGNLPIKTPALTIVQIGSGATVMIDMQQLKNLHYQTAAGKKKPDDA